MIDKVLGFLRRSLDVNLKINTGVLPGSPESSEELVTFVDGEKLDPIAFKLNAVTVMLINLEADNSLRAADPFNKMLRDGSKQHVHPSIRLNLFVLFVTRFKSYQNGLRHLSLIIKFFQRHRLIDRESFPDLDQKIEQLTVELVTLPFAEQNEIWNALRTTYHPSVLYKVRLVEFADEDAVQSTSVSERILDIKEIS
ncbi:MAG: DUF4255 domain-containing protein [Gammaproteobacteria bacterium]